MAKDVSKVIFQDAASALASPELTGSSKAYCVKSPDGAVELYAVAKSPEQAAGMVARHVGWDAKQINSKRALPPASEARVASLAAILDGASDDEVDAFVMKLEQRRLSMQKTRKK